MTGRAATVLFGLVCTGGAAAALGLAVHEATRTVPVAAEVVTTTRQGLATIAQVEVRNDTSSVRCVQVRVVAQDRDGRDLATAGVREVQLAPRGLARFPAGLELTARQYVEQLVRVRAAVRGC